MKDNLKDILSNSNKDIDNQKLMDYLSGGLSNEEAHELEKSMADSEFLNDAVEGLDEFKDKENLNFYVEKLNKDLYKNLDKKRSRKDKRKLRDQPWILFAIILLLALIIISFFVIKSHLDQQ